MKLKNKVSIVTGGGKGIGHEIALSFAREGCDVVVADIDKENIGRVCGEIKGLGRKALEVYTDVSKSADIKVLFDRTMLELGRIDILVNNAAYIKYAKFLEFREEEWEKVMDVGLKGYFLCAQAVAREMVRNRSGKIINIASVAGEVGFQNGCAYCSSKGGVIALTKVMAIELGPYGINVNAIAPGPTDTGGLRSLFVRRGYGG
jgi:NAD(P)-dependent dehydrogenase (short-subunit alcohol dehydrogenase family)